MIIARGLAADIEGQALVFDYAGCMYPEGLVGDKVGYFNHGDIARVVFEGFNDDDNTMMVDNINAWLTTVPYPRGGSMKDGEQVKSESGI